MSITIQEITRSLSICVFFWKKFRFSRRQYEFKVRMFYQPPGKENEKIIINFQDSQSAGKLFRSYSRVAGLMLILRSMLPDSNLFAIVTLCPNKQYLGIFRPTTPAKTVPV